MLYMHLDLATAIQKLSQFCGSRTRNEFYDDDSYMFSVSNPVGDPVGL